MFDIIFIIKQLSDENANLKISYCQEVIKVVQYLKSTIYQKITNRAIKVNLKLYKIMKYTNNNHSNNLKDKKNWL